MEVKELEKLQRYIYKRNQGQSTEEVISHILKINKKFNLSPEEWDKLLIPTCSVMDADLFQWLLNQGAGASSEVQIDCAKWIVSSQENRLIYQEKRVAIFEILLPAIKDPAVLEEALGEALKAACWYNNLYVVEYLVAAGGNLFFQKELGKTPYELAKNYGERFEDYTLYGLIVKSLVKGKMLTGTRKFF